MSASADLRAECRNDELVDVLIIGAGASGAAVAWCLAETRKRTLFD